ncbi:zf-HC2 domain-containing protein [Streptomyces omiyaensis]|uniref:Anti-sigma factor family protein n=1 Tax=Streptomyces omiyaensis TaxID=68247 RepID=A0ABW7BTN0_9ACTN|nr:zf-HC2 domain-containing protein [Streptomyces omiyaensis]GGY64110.1 membrane protein [Streptomyces omiyaensis]
MSGTHPPSPSPAEHHLGDRLAALVDGELGHDARERVLAHLATCARCKAEADAQRALKSVFASSGAPQPSEGFLARLQGLPGGPGDPGRSPLEQLLEAGGVKSDGFATAPPAVPETGTGFRVHAVAPSGRGRRFAVAAAGAVSFAAIALGGTLPVESSLTTTARGGQGTGSAVTPLRAGASTGPGTGSVVGRSDRSERSGGAQALGSAPLVPGGTVPSGAVPADVDRAGPVAAVRLRAVQAHPLLALSPFVRPGVSALRPVLGPAPSPAAGPPGSPR